MGTPKAQLQVAGSPLGKTLAGQLASCCERVTVLGRDPLDGFAFVADAEEYQGPLVALANFHPQAEWVFVASCDLVNFDARVIQSMMEVRQSNAVIPFSHGQLQPLCALYQSSVFDIAKTIVANGKRSMMSLVDAIGCFIFGAEEFDRAGLNEKTVVGVNTKEELQHAMQEEAH